MSKAPSGSAAIAVRLSPAMRRSSSASATGAPAVSVRIATAGYGR